MKILHFILFILFILFFLLSACIQLKPKKIPSFPSPVLDKSIFCERIETEDNWAYPAREKAIFIKGKDKRIYSFLSFKNVKEEHFLEWKWYDPQNKIYRSSRRIKIGEEGKYFEKFIAWDNIFLFEEKESGKWKVAVFLDDKILDVIEFEIK